MQHAAVRALGWATLAGLALETVRPGSAVHPHWMGSSGSAAADSALAALFGLLAAGGARGRFARGAGIRARWRPALQALTGGAASLLCARALAAHLAALADGRLGAAGWAPPVTLLALLLVGPWTARAVGLLVRAGPPEPSPGRTPQPPAGGTSRLAFGTLRPWLATLAAGALLTLGQIAATGATDYRAPADAILVLGARVHPDGRPSGALADRTRTAVALHQAGWAPLLVLSGGHGAGAPVSEPAAMAALCREAGVPAEALQEDPTGLTTADSIATLARLARERGWREVLVVSHDYHLARIRLLAARAGLRVRTVPARETHPPRWKVLATAREVPAYLAAWLLP